MSSVYQDWNAITHQTKNVLIHRFQYNTVKYNSQTLTQTPLPAPQNQDLHRVRDPIWVIVLIEDSLYQRGYRWIIPDNVAERMREVFSYGTATINDVFQRVTSHGLGSPSTHYLITLSGRPLNDINATIFEANKKRNIEMVKEDKGLHLMLRPIRWQAQRDDHINPPNDTTSQNNENNGAVRLRGSGDNPPTSMETRPGECIGCGTRATAGGQCLDCGAPVEPLDQTFHYDFGWKLGPRLQNTMTIANNPSPMATESMVSRLLASLTGILKPPHSPRATELLNEALLKLRANQVTRLVNLSMPAVLALNALSGGDDGSAIACGDGTRAGW